MRAGTERVVKMAKWSEMPRSEEEMEVTKLDSERVIMRSRV